MQQMIGLQRLYSRYAKRHAKTSHFDDKQKREIPSSSLTVLSSSAWDKFILKIYAENGHRFTTIWMLSYHHKTQ
jgi:hypothetical protein